MDRIGLLMSEGDSPAVNVADFDLASSVNGRLSKVAFRTTVEVFVVVPCSCSDQLRRRSYRGCL